jgi:methylenetetrahydrofolate--tRNA-(uracil-5-)-methyltransferase
VITVVGGGFAGCEAAWGAANRGVKVRLYEMRPQKQTPAHVTDYLAELVCSNSFKSLNPDSPAGQLKAEMEALGSLMIPVAKKHAVPGGEALAVDRNLFAAEMTALIEGHPNIEVVREEWDGTLFHHPPTGGEPPTIHGRMVEDTPLIIATGPLTSDGLSQKLQALTGSEHLHFYDAVAPTVEASSIDRSIVWEQSRYDKGDAAYLNCPFDQQQYEAFIEALLAAEQSIPHDFEKGKYFEGCMPIEEIAARGRDSLRFGNMKPVGLTNPNTGKRAYAVLQLRPENREKTLYSMVACQSRMKWGEQKRVLRMVPGLENAEFVRFGVIHQNLYLDSPRLIGADFQVKSRPGLFFAGQITGVEGYVESGAVGILAGINAARLATGKETTTPPRACAYGSLAAHVTNDHTEEFSPMNINWGLFPDPEPHIKDKGARRAAKLAAARSSFEDWLKIL